MYDRILVAVDGSETSRLAMLEALKLTKEQRSAFHIVNVMEISMPYIMNAGRGGQARVLNQARYDNGRGLFGKYAAVVE